MRSNRSAQSSAKQAYTHIKERVISGAYGAGERLTEVQLAQDLGTSRTPVREAMRLLVAEGFLYFRPNHGTFVRAWSADEIRDIFDLRLLLESEIAANAARHISGKALAQLRMVQANLEACGAQVNEATLNEMNNLNRDFHRIIGEASENARLSSMLANAIEVPIVQRTFRRYNRAQLERSFQHHRELIDALSCRDAEWARDIMSCHIRSAKFAMLRNGETE